MITITDAVIAHPDHRLPKPVSLTLSEGEQMAIVGRNASGKSRLVDLITGQWPLRQGSQAFEFSGSPHRMASQNIRYISFRDSYGEADATYYLQQRWNHHDIDPATPTVGELLQRAVAAATADGHSREAQVRAAEARLVELFNLTSLLDKYVIALSSGEMRKLQLTRALLAAPRVLVIDNPFIGLDADARDQLRQLLQTLIAETALQVVLVLSRESEIPDFVTSVVAVCPDGTVLPQRAWHGHDASCAALASDAGLTFSEPVLSHEQQRLLPQLLAERQAGTAACEVLSARNVTVTYGGRTILGPVNWTVQRGDHWALTGPNGAGKSTLLSIVCADNPQAYAADVSLFGRRRGTGESIWDIKRHIGYVSPEMHRAYMRDLPAIDIVASGLSDSVGLYHRPTPAEQERCKLWMRVFGIDHLAERTFMHLSSGEQRLCLVARAFVKSPELLILDEPFHGLDNYWRTLVCEVIDAYCAHPWATVIIVSHYTEELEPLRKYHLQTYRLSLHNDSPLSSSH